ncbi:MAG: helix-turn-helix transcriptional regulator, partial [Clostridia bacterium]|nr:helix-turn-helix transcriptional regulator [Clostridia bacterium]
AEPHAGDTLQGKGGLLERLLNARTMQELEDVVFQILRQLQDQHDQTQDQLSAKLEAVTHYISANYYDQNLSVQMLADRFGLSLPYLSREFKNSKGIGVLNYINQYRIDKAKEILLHDEDATLADVAQRVGYSSSQTLIRIFKRYAGVTPGQFREAGKNAHGA